MSKENIKEYAKFARKLNDGLASKREKYQLVALDLAGYRDSDLMIAIIKALDELSDKKGLPSVDMAHVKKAIKHLRFKKYE